MIFEDNPILAYSKDNWKYIQQTLDDLHKERFWEEHKEEIELRENSELLQQLYNDYKMAVKLCKIKNR